MRHAFGEDLYIGLERRVEAVVVERARGFARFPLCSRPLCLCMHYSTVYARSIQLCT